jgi:catechol 2,3-dioxygenase-like lactoylglutathione lyase family enzyme
MGGAAGQGPFPGEVRQVGHVVPDLDVAMDEWLAVGIGPWTVIEVTQRNGDYRGRPSEATTAIGFSHAGAMQIELIQAKGDGASIWHEARHADRFGPHHLAYWADDFEETMQRVADAGLAVVQSGDGNGIARFVYIESPSRGSLVEIMELNDISLMFMDDIRASCESWDGRGPGVRR